MQIKITARKFKARESLKDFISAEVEALGKFYDQIMDVEVILSFRNNKENEKTAEIVAKIPGTILTAAEDAEEFEKAMRLAVEKLQRQLEKIKTKKITH